MAVGGLSTVGGIEYEAKITPIVVISCIMAATGGLMFGYDIGISGGVTSMPDFLKKFFPVVYKSTQEKGLDSNYCKYDNEGLQMFTSSLYLAALIATFGASYTTRSLGRRLTMLIAGIFFIIGTILNAAAINFLMLVLGRLMLGCSVGFANQVNPEASTPIYSLRGLDNFKFFSLSFYWYCARTYVQLDDGTELLDAVMFGDVAENVFSCTAVQLRSYSDEKHKLFVQKTTRQLLAKKWRIQLYVDANRTMSSKYNQFTIQAVEPMED